MTYTLTYVYGETEVHMTGRTATKSLPGGKLMVLVEITPVNSYDGDWKKFVNQSALLTIIPAKDLK
jgi:hypothetical protein